MTGLSSLGGLPLAGFTILISYLIGAIPFGYWVARWRGVDILKSGSGNIGATNVGRVLGRRFGILVFLLDFAKGAVPTAIALGLGRIVSDSNPWLVTALPVLAGLSAFVGHVFPVYLKFRGGKGVATGAGVVAVLLPIPMLLGLLAWVLIVGLTRYVSLASLTACVILCFSHVALTPAPFGSDNWILTCFAFLAIGLVFARHHANILRLLQGNENRLPESAFMKQIPKILHVLAIGLWFGSAVFFVIVALVVFQSFESLGSSSRSRARVRLVFPPAIYLRVYRGGYGIFLGPGRTVPASSPPEKPGSLIGNGDGGHRLARGRLCGRTSNRAL